MCSMGLGWFEEFLLHQLIHPHQHCEVSFSEVCPHLPAL